MDDHHGQLELDLAHHQLPPCPCVVHTTIEIIIIIIVLHVTIFYLLMSFSHGILGSDVLDIATWLNHNGLQVTSIRSLRKLSRGAS